MLATEDLINRIHIYGNVQAEKNRDVFLKSINTITNNKLRNNHMAQKELFKNKKIKALCNEFGFDDLDILIGGSTAMAAVYKYANFIPNDLDLYMLHVSYDKIIKLEQAIKTVYSDCKIIVIRSIITLTWIIYKGNTKMNQIQLNILKLHSWADIFVTCHSDITCMGYDVLNQCFVFLKGRWDNIVKNKVHYFCNVLSCDTAKSLNRAIEKYNERGFKCDIIYVDNRTHGINFGISNHTKIHVSDEDEELPLSKKIEDYVTPNEIIKHLLEKYKGIENIFYSISAKFVFPDKNTPLCINMWKFSKDEKFNDFIATPSNIKLKCKNESNCNCDNICPIELTHHNLFVKNRYCQHSVSLRSYIYHHLDKCPICRIDFIGDEIICL